MSHFDTPSSGIPFKGLVGINAHVRGDEGIPGTVPLPVEEELDVHTGILGLNGSGLVTDGTVTPGLLGLIQLGNDIRRREVAQGGFIFGSAHFDHPYEVALEVVAVDELEEFRAGEPTVDQQIIKPQAFQDASSEHLDGTDNFGLEHFLFTGVYLLVFTALLAILGGSLLPGKSLWLIGILPGLCLYGGIHHQLRLAVRVAEKQGLEAQDLLHDRMGKHLAKALGLIPSFGKVGIVKNDAAGSILCIGPSADETNQLAVDGVEDAPPVYASIIHQAVKRVLLAGKQLAKGAVRIIRRCLNGEERLQDEQFH